MIERFRVNLIKERLPTLPCGAEVERIRRLLGPASESDARMRETAAHALGILGPRMSAGEKADCVPTLNALIDDSDDGIRAAAQLAIFNLGL